VWPIGTPEYRSAIRVGRMSRGGMVLSLFPAHSSLHNLLGPDASRHRDGARNLMRHWPETKRRRARIEIIPMIDLMMFLLVFFVLVSINVIPALGIKITPPSSTKTERIIERKKLMLGIDADGNTFLDGAPVALAEVPGRIRAMALEQAPVVVIDGDSGTALFGLLGYSALNRQAESIIQNFKRFLLETTI
jgi:biopolymer transport protein ExbD